MELPQGLQVKDASVVLEGVHANLMSYVAHLALVHRLLFGEDLIITSGMDAQHMVGSLHGQGRAVDVRTSDVDPAGAVVLVAVLAYTAPAHQICYLDERGLPGAAHIHIEYHGV